MNEISLFDKNNYDQSNIYKLLKTRSLVHIWAWVEQLEIYAAQSKQNVSFLENSGTKCLIMTDNQTSKRTKLNDIHIDIYSSEKRNLSRYYYYYCYCYNCYNCYYYYNYNIFI